MIEELSMEFGIKDCCEALEVSRSGYYQWQKHEVGKRAQANRVLGERIGEVFEAHKGRYGSPRMTRALREAGVRCGENRVARLMRERGLAARPKRAFRPRTTRAGAIAAAPNLIKDLAPSGPDQISRERHHLRGDPAGLALPGRDPGLLQPLGSGLEAGL